MSALAKWTVPRLMAIAGVANVSGASTIGASGLVDRRLGRWRDVAGVVKATGEAVSLQAGGFLDT